MTKCFKRILTNDNFMSEWFLCLIYASLHLKNYMIYMKISTFSGAVVQRHTGPASPYIFFFGSMFFLHTLQFHTQCTYNLNEFENSYCRLWQCACIQCVCVPKSERLESKTAQKSSVFALASKIAGKLKWTQISFWITAFSWWNKNTIVIIKFSTMDLIVRMTY